MVTSKLCFAAVAVIRDADSNGITAFNILEGVTAAGLPFLMQNLSFFVLWQREHGDAEQFPGRFALSLDNQVLQEIDIRVDFQGGTRNRTVVNIGGLVVPRPGFLHFRLRLEAGAQAEYSVEITPPSPIAQVHQ